MLKITIAQVILVALVVENVKKVSLFGSYARGEADDNSDVDLYIDKGRLKSLLQYF